MWNEIQALIAKGDLIGAEFLWQELGVEEDRRDAAFEKAKAEGHTRGASGAGGLYGAASGFDGMVTEPTLFLTGEDGPERVKVTPAKMMQEPGFTGADGPNFHFNITVQAFDSRDLDRYVREELGPKIVKYTQGYSRRGGAVMDDTGARRVAAA